LEDLVGFFVNMVALRLEPVPAVPFRHFLRAVHGIAVDAIDRQDVPFEKVVEALAPTRQADEAPLVQALIVLQRTETGGQTLNGLTVSPIRGGTPRVRFDVEVHAHEEEDGIAIAFTTRAGRFSETRTKALCAHFADILTAASQVPDRPLQELAPPRKSLIPAAKVPSGAPTIAQMMASAVEMAPERTALVTPSARRTWRDLDTRTNRLAHHLRAAGAGPEKIVALVLPRTLTTEAVLAVAKTGAAWLPIDPDAPAPRKAAILEACRPVATLTEEDLWPLDEETLQAGPIPLAMAPTSLAYVLPTSGSTGEPKNVAVTHEGLKNLVASDSARHHAEEGAVVLGYAAPTFDVSVWELVLTLYTAGTLVVPPAEIRADARILDLMAAEGVTHTLLPPALLSVLEPRPLPSLAALLSGGEAVPAALAARWSAHVPLVNAYGPTEATVMCTNSRAGVDDAGATIGLPIDGTVAVILDSSLAPVADGTVGELWVAGPHLARSYLGRPGMTAERFIAAPFGPPGARMYRTGDLASQRPDGTIRYHGRADMQLKVRGVRIEPSEVERVLCADAAVRDALVTAEGEGADRHLIAYVVADTAKPDEDVGRAQLEDWRALYENTYGASGEPDD
ncbi:MAG: amino acid adenylation domain-containing protein, partial [Pseudomonadota bacterium]